VSCSGALGDTTCAGYTRPLLDTQISPLGQVDYDYNINHKLDAYELARMNLPTVDYQHSISASTTTTTTTTPSTSVVTIGGASLPMGGTPTGAGGRSKETWRWERGRSSKSSAYLDDLGIKMPSHALAWAARKPLAKHADEATSTSTSSSASTNSGSSSSSSSSGTLMKAPSVFKSDGLAVTRLEGNGNNIVSKVDVSSIGSSRTTRGSSSSTSTTTTSSSRLGPVTMNNEPPLGLTKPVWAE
jgi:hypothetical protein